MFQPGGENIVLLLKIDVAQPPSIHRINKEEEEKEGGTKSSSSLK